MFSLLELAPFIWLLPLLLFFCHGHWQVMWLACVIFRDTQVHTPQQNVSLHLRTEAGVKMKSMLFCWQTEAVLSPGQRHTYTLTWDKPYWGHCYSSTPLDQGPHEGDNLEGGPRIISYSYILVCLFNGKNFFKTNCNCYYFLKIFIYLFNNAQMGLIISCSVQVIYYSFYFLFIYFLHEYSKNV